MQIGTYLMSDPGADYGAKDLIQSNYSTNALRDGGAFAYRSVGPRKMSFPLLLRDVPGQTRTQTESLLREWTTAGAAVAVQPEGIPSGQAVFFDVLDGRWEPAFDTFENRAERRRGTLLLDTQPWGYWPTEILLASSASIGNFGQLTVKGASVIGDVPPLAHVYIGPSVASQIAPVGRWNTDMLAWSLAGRPSFNPFIPAAAFTFDTNGAYGGAPALASLVADAVAPGSQAWQVGSSLGGLDGVGSGWTQALFAPTFISSALEPAYRGRFRCFSFFKLMKASAGPWGVIVDADRYNPSVFAPLASANQLASGWSFAGAINASPCYDILDMGEFTLPPSASGYQQGMRLRIWANPVMGVGSAVNTTARFAGLYLLPVDGPAGILPRGLTVPTLTGPSGIPAAALEMNAGFVDSILLSDTSAASRVLADGRTLYRGVTPRLGASTAQLTFLTGDRQMTAQAGGTYAVVQANREVCQVSVSYRPTFQFLAGL